MSKRNRRKANRRNQNSIVKFFRVVVSRFKEAISFIVKAVLLPMNFISVFLVAILRILKDLVVKFIGINNSWLLVIVNVVLLVISALLVGEIISLQKAIQWKPLVNLLNEIGQNYAKIAVGLLEAALAYVIFRSKEEPNLKKIIGLGNASLLIILVILNCIALPVDLHVTDLCYGVNSVDRTKVIRVLFAKFEQTDPNDFPVNEWSKLKDGIVNVTRVEKVDLINLDKVVKKTEEAQRLNDCYGSVLTIWGNVGKISIGVHYTNSIDSDIKSESDRQTTTTDQADYTDFTRFVEKGADNDFVLSILAGEIQMGNKKYSLAEQSYSDAIYLGLTTGIKDAKLEVVYNSRGIVYQHDNKQKEAMDDFNKAISINPEYASSYVNLGTIYDEKGDYDSALKFYDEAANYDSESPALHVNKGLALEHKGDYSAAMKELQEAEKHKDLILAQDQLAALYYNMAVVSVDLRQNDQALELLDKAIGIYPDFIYAHENKGWLLYTMGRYEEARVAYGNALKINPNSIAALVGYGMSSGKLRKLGDAESYLKKASELDSSNPMIYADLGDVQRLEGKLEDAKISFKRAIDIAPNDPKYAEAHWGYGAALHDLNPMTGRGMNEMTIEAMKAMEDAIRLDPMDPLFPFPYRDLGVMYMELENSHIFYNDDGSQSLKYLEIYAQLTNHSDAQAEQWIRMIKARIA